MDEQMIEIAHVETERLQRELDITNADHIALWLEANTVLDEPMSQCISWLACRIVEAYEATRAECSPHPLPHPGDCSVHSTGSCDCGVYDAAHSVMARKIAELKGAATALLDKVNADSSVRWKFFNELQSLRAALAPHPERRGE